MTAAEVVKEVKEDNSLIPGQLTLEEVITKFLGSFGPFQKWLTAYICFVIGPVTSMNMISQFLILLIPPHECSLGNELVNISSYQQESYNSSLPIIPNPLNLLLQNDGSCMIRRSLENAANLTDIVPCQSGWDYNHELIYPTLVSERDWVCGERWKALLPHSIYWAGATIGCFVFGAFSDTFGRVPTSVAIFMTAGLSGIAGLLLSHNYALFVVTRGLMGFAFTGSVTLVLVIEFVGLRNRLLVSTVFVTSHSVTSALWSAFAYYIGNWRLLLILGSLAQFLVPVICIFTPESVRWLYSKGRVDEGAKVLRKVAAFNGKTLPDGVVESIIVRKPVPFRFKEIFGYPNLCRNFILSGILSILNGIVFIGTNLYAALLLKNPFLVLSVNAFIDAIAGFVSKTWADKHGRRRVMLVNTFSSCLLYTSSYFLDTDSIYFMIIFYLARFTIAMTFNILYLYVAEIVPTFFRSRAVSTRLCLNNFGAFIAPFIIGLYVYGSFIPLVVFGFTAAIAGILVLFLPETLGVPLPETCEEANNL